ncbi:MAG: T9SS type A sorting domain-containing protein [Dysgonomonas sp.]
MKKLYSLILIFFGISLFFGVAAQNQLGNARIYINPGHGGWGSNDRPLATINYPVLDTLGFFETNTNLLKGLKLRDELEKAGAGYVKISRTKNGIISSESERRYSTEIIEGGDQIITLSVIAQDVETNNMDYFLSIHSNAAAEGSLTNYPLLLYRGYDSKPGNGLTYARDMARDAWKWINDNGITYHSHYTTEDSNNSRGDISFMGDSVTSPQGYVGYYGVLRHGCDGFLSEGCFHTYQPERHRLLNKDYCRQEGVRYSRAIRAWFGDNTETKGAIMGTIKDRTRSLENALYKYRAGSNDQYYPMNETTVILQDNNGTELKRYVTDKEYNGVYVFEDLNPGTYKLVYEVPDHDNVTAEIEVTANKTSFINQLVGGDPEPIDTEVKYYTHPEQDGDIAGASEYNFVKEYELKDVDALKDLTVRRAILRDGKYYVLAIDAAKNPKLLVLNPTDGTLIKEMSTTGVVTTGFNGKEYPYILSDIAFTNDGVLIAVNSTVIGRENNGYQKGDFYMYKWQATESIALEDATPEVLLTIPTNTAASLAWCGNNYSNFMANSIAVNGDLNDFNFYFDSHAGEGWNTTYGLMFMYWNVKNGQIATYQRNDISYTESQLGEDVRMTLSPTKIHRLIVDGNGIVPKEFELSTLENKATEIANFSENIPVESTGANYFRYAGRIYMSAPVCDKVVSTYSYKTYLYDITDGLDKAKNIGVTDAVITDQPAVTYMASYGVVDNADIDQYLLVGNNIVKYTTKGQPVADSPARIFAYGLESLQTATGYDISFQLNEDADAADLILTNSETEEEVKTVSLGALAKGANQTSITFNDIPEGITCNWSIRVAADNVTRFVKLSDDSKAYQYFAPKGVAVDKSPESDYFGRVYVTNTAAGATTDRSTTTGVYVLGPDGSDITGQGDNAYAGGISWTGTNTESPRKVAVASDGRVFVCDASAANAGVYVMNPETFAMASLFTGATNTGGKLTIGGTYVGGQFTAIGIRGTGASTQLYTVDKSTEGASTWKKFVNVYNIGEATSWTTAPNYSKAASSYLGNDNNSIVPVSTGYWGGQYREPGAGHNAGTPALFYYSDAKEEAIFNSAQPLLFTSSSKNGGLAVSEKENILVLSTNTDISVFSYKMKSDGSPEVSLKFSKDLGATGATYDDFAFDYAGNLYALSNSGKQISVWAMPTAENNCVVPAKKSMVLKRDDTGIESVQNQVAKVYPNPVTNYLTVELTEVINTVAVYDIAGKLINNNTNIGSNSTTVDFTSLAPGIYLVKVNNGKAIKVVKK